jgi:iron complex outermembrane recepter protein
MTRLRNPAHGTRGGLLIGALLGATCLTATLPFGTAFAQTVESAGGGVEEVVVTARHRSENVQNIPANVSVLGGEFLTQTNTNDLTQLAQYLPSLQFVELNPRNTQINIRGLGALIGLASDGLDPGTGFYVDGVYYNRPAQATFNLVDVDNIAVLNGPQGTLFGKNSTAGAVVVTTASPSFDPGFTAEASAGNYNYFQAKGDVTGPLIDDVLAGRISIEADRRDGLYTNVFNGDRLDDGYDYSVRGQLLYTPTSDFKVRLIADYEKQYLDGPTAPVLQIFTPPSGFNFRNVVGGLGWTNPGPFPEIDINSPVFARQQASGVSAEADWSLPWATLTSITAARYWGPWQPFADSDFTPLPIINAVISQDKEQQFTQEFRIASSGTNDIDYVAGAYFFHEDVRQFVDTSYGPDAAAFYLSPTTPSAALNGLTQFQNNKYRTNSFAGYSQATWHILPKLNLTGGLRYTDDAKFGRYNAVVGGAAPLTNPPFTNAQIATFTADRNAFLVPGAYTDNAKNGELAGHADLSYQATEDAMVYASFSRGFRSDGINLTQLPAGVPSVVQPESINAYEVGAKTQSFDHRLTLNADVFYEDDHDYQANVFNTTLRALYLSNVPKVWSKGAEISAQALPFDDLSLYSSVTYDDAIYDDYPAAQCPVEQPVTVPATKFCNLSGKQLPGAPRWAASAGFEFRQHVELLTTDDQAYFGLDESYRSRENTGASDSIYTEVSSLNLLNLRLGLRTSEEHWDVYFWGKNVANVRYYIVKSATAQGLQTGFPGDPATFGVTVRVKY